jgi:hypothetical protein
MTNKIIKRDLPFMFLDEAVYSVKLGQLREVLHRGNPGPNKSVMEFFSRLVRGYKKESYKKELYEPIYFFLWRHVRTELDLLKMLYEKMKIRPLALLTPKDDLISHVSYICTMQRSRVYFCFDNCQVVPEQILDSIRLLSRTLNCKMLMLHRPPVSHYFSESTEPRLKMMFRTDLERFLPRRSHPKVNRARAPTTG